MKAIHFVWNTQIRNFANSHYVNTILLILFYVIQRPRSYMKTSLQYALYYDLLKLRYTNIFLNIKIETKYRSRLFLSYVVLYIDLI